MNILTVDFETYYSKEFSLTKYTTEQYVRDDQFEVIGVAVAKDDEDAVWFSGSHDEIAQWFKQFDWGNSFVLAHNTAFDGAILGWRFGIKPKGWLDTMCMSRALNNGDAGNSLASLAKKYDIGVKGTDVANAMGMRRDAFSPTHLKQYGEYCCNDVELTRTLFHRFMLPGLGEAFPARELKVIDCTLRMFIEPRLTLNTTLLQDHLDALLKMKASLLEAAQEDKDTLMSNAAFAEALRNLNVDPPTKVSERTKKTTWAFAKTDEGFKKLAEHPDPRVQALVSARIGHKTTLEETRTQRFLGIAERGLMPVPLRYFAAHTGRWGGDDKVNLQNLPSRGQNAGRLKRAICAPDGYVMIDCDSSQIEARVVAWLAGQQDLLDAFEKGEDVYKIMASAIYNKPVDEIDKPERFVGKTTILGCGYGMGAQKFQDQLKVFGHDVPLHECERIIDVYRKTYEKIPQLWRNAQNCLHALMFPSAVKFSDIEAVVFDATQKGFLLPDGIWRRYREVRSVEGGFEYAGGIRGYVKIYGGKLVENICQAVARCVIAEQMLLIAKRYKVVMTVHDAVACIAPEDEADEAQKYVEQCMRTRPAWAATLPLNCESGKGKSYGEC